MFVDFTDLKLEMGIAKIEHGDEEILNWLATMIVEMWDDLTNRTWATTAYTAEIHSTNGNQSIFSTDNYPITAIADIWDDPNWEYPDSDKLDASTYDFSYDAGSGMIYSDTLFLKGPRNIKISYTAGYTDTNVPKWLKQLLIRQACHWFHQRNEQTWHRASKALPDGGVVTFNTLKANLLPDFMYFADFHRRRG